MKRLIVLFITVVLTLCACTAEMPEVTGSFEVDVLKVGKADAIVLRTQNHAVVIDCGEKGDGKEVLGCLSENGFEKIDYLFITHFDQDHVGGATKVINNIEIGQIITPDYIGIGSEYEKFIEAMEENGLEAVKLKKNMSFTLDDVLFEVYPPMRSEYEESDNDYSIVISVTHGENTFLFAGDAETDRLGELPRQFGQEHDFLKVPHHGKYDKGSDQFLNSVKPKYAVITCSEKNPAEPQILELLEKLGCEVYLTTNGNVHAVSDGKTIDIE